MITKIRPINLKRRFDKLAAYYGGMHTSFVPFDVIEPFEAHDAKDYPDGFAVREAASKEFPFWKKLSDEWIRDGWLKRGSLCCLWSMQSVLEIIASSNDHLAVMCTDGSPFVMNWFDMQQRLRKLPPFDIFQLWHSDDSPSYPYYDWYPSPVEVDDSVSYGLAGLGDGCFILSPYGADLMLEWCEETPYHNIEVMVYGKASERLDGCLSTIKQYEWIRPHIDFEEIFGRVLSERTFLDDTDGGFAL